MMHARHITQIVEYKLSRKHNMLHSRQQQQLYYIAPPPSLVCVYVHIVFIHNIVGCMKQAARTVFSIKAQQGKPAKRNTRRARANLQLKTKNRARLNAANLNFKWLFACK